MTELVTMFWLPVALNGFSETTATGVVGGLLLWLSWS
jgi:hypothetical protein